MTHYDLHAELDFEHAEDFLELVEPAWDEPARRDAVIAGLELGVYVFDRLYQDMHSAAMAERSRGRPGALPSASRSAGQVSNRDESLSCLGEPWSECDTNEPPWTPNPS